MTDPGPDGTATPEPAGYLPKSPLWQPAPQPRSKVDSAGTVVVVLAALAVVGCLFVVMGEGQFLTTPATESLVTVAAIAGTSHGDEHHPPTIRYEVRLEDGSIARFASSHTYPVGTRLKAMVARGRVTNRVVVSGPYVALPAE